jgi:Concanavalin A-like lectin/glucanases superfamily/Domain of unknown function (DUF1929)/Bacterial Ig domain
VVVALVAAAVIVAGPSSRSVAQSTAGLVAAYGFNEGTGAAAADVSGNNLVGKIVGATWTTAGRYGQALSFNGASSYVDLGNAAALQLTGSMTVEAWVRAAANPADDGQIVAKSDDSGWQLKTSPDTGPQTFGAKAWSTAASAQRYTTTVRSLNTWYHVASVYDATARTLQIYVNGVLDNGSLGGTVPAGQTNRPVNVNIGRRTGGYYFNGIIDEVRIYNRALAQIEIQSDMNTPVGGTPPPPDTVPPQVSITSPATGDSITTATVVSASASDNVGVAGVQFRVDGAPLGGEVNVPPYSVSWNALASGVGPHTLTAVARDAFGNTTTSGSVAVVVAASPASQVGQWSAVMPWPIVAVHASLLPTGNVLAWTDYTINEGAQLWRPATNTFTAKPYSTTSLFCSGHSFLADGRLFVAGGIVGLIDDLGPRESSIFDPVTESWSQGGSMTTGRYYPTTTTLGDGRVLVLGGTTTCVTCIADRPEIYDPQTNVWTQLAASASLAFQYYPHPYVLPDGRVLVAAQDDRAIGTRVLNLNTQTWTTIDPGVFDGHSSAMYLPGKIVKAGTATADNPGFPAAPTTYVLDMAQPAPAWQATASMAFSRSYLNLTLLPDGTVLATGGGTVTDKADFSHAVFEAELWSPASKTWTTLAREQIPRLYHSTALLLPDARVLVAGGGREAARSQPDPKDQLNAEIFSPPYLFKGARPVVTSAPSIIPYHDVFSVVTPDAARVSSVSLIALGAVTHAFNQNQRFVPLAFTPADGSLNVTGPIDGNTAPPGWYMLFLVDGNGVPSVAAMVRLAVPAVAADTTSPVVSLTSPVVGATVSGSVVLGATASDDVGVAGVQFLLDGAPMGTEQTGPGPTYSLNWASNSTTNGPHTLSARARDGAGNTTVAAGVGITVTNAPTTAGLVASYAFNEGSGAVATDGSGHGLTGTIVGAAWTAAGKYGKALSFNGSSSYVDLGNPAALQLTGSMTVEAWVRAAANPADDGQIVAKSDASGWQLKTSPDTGPHTFGARVWSSSTNTQRYSTTVRALNTWYHVASVYDATARTHQLYVNGVLDNGTLKGTVPAAQTNRAVNVNIGRRTGGFYFNGVIDEVRIYNRALSPTEVQTDMNTPLP